MTRTLEHLLENTICQLELHDLEGPAVGLGFSLGGQRLDKRKAALWDGKVGHGGGHGCFLDVAQGLEVCSINEAIVVVCAS